MNMIFLWRNIFVKVLLIVSLGELSLADVALPTSSKQSSIDLPTSNKSQSVKKNSAELPISLEVSESNSNSKLSKGKGCVNIKGLKEAEGEEFIDFPMAETIPCDEVGCKDLKPAKLHDDKYQDLPTAESEASCEEEE